MNEEAAKKLAESYDLQKLAKDLGALKDYGYPVYDKEAEWKALQEKIAQQKSPKRRVIPFYTKFAAAIVLLVGFSIFWFVRDTRTFVETDFAETKSVYLPDSSLVRLNAGSQVAFDAETWAEDRSIELEGEAYFRVKKGKAFVVKNELARLEVLGTSFNIKARGGNYTARCFTGKVCVDFEQKEVILTPNLGVSLHNGVINNFEFGETEPDWERKQLEYSDEKLTQVFEELQINYGFDIRYDKSIFESRKFSASIPSDNIEAAALIIATAMEIEYEINTKSKEAYFYSKK